MLALKVVSWNAGRWPRWDVLEVVLVVVPLHHVVVVVVSSSCSRWFLVYKLVGRSEQTLMQLLLVVWVLLVLWVGLAVAVS